MAAGVAKAARPVVVESVERSHLALGIDLDARLLYSTAGTAIDTREALAAGDLPAFVIRVVVGTKVEIGGDRDVPHPADAVVMFPDDRRRRVDLDARDNLGTADPGAHFLDRPEQPDRGRKFVPAVVEYEDAAAALHLLKLPTVTARGYVPAAAAAAHHLHVVAVHVSEQPGFNRLLELSQRLVEQIVLHHAQHTA